MCLLFEDVDLKDSAAFAYGYSMQSEVHKKGVLLLSDVNKLYISGKKGKVLTITCLGARLLQKWLEKDTKVVLRIYVQSIR